MRQYKYKKLFNLSSRDIGSNFLKDSTYKHFLLHDVVTYHFICMMYLNNTIKNQQKWPAH